MLKILIGESQKAVHEVLHGVHIVDTSEKSLRVLFEVKEDQPVFQGVISNVTVESTGNITQIEVLLVMRDLAQEMGGRVGQAARFYLENWIPSSEDIKKGFKSIADNNLQSIRQACQKMNDAGCS